MNTQVIETQIFGIQDPIARFLGSWAEGLTVPSILFRVIVATPMLFMFMLVTGPW